MPLITTIHGEIDEALLERTLQFTDAPNEFTVTVEWHRPWPNGNKALVRRDAHVILKRVPAAAQSVVAALSR